MMRLHGRSLAEQIDGERQLPGDSGLIDLKGFMQALVNIGYDGPVRAEPFNAKLNAMENDQALGRQPQKAMWRTINLVLKTRESFNLLVQNFQGP